MDDLGRGLIAGFVATIVISLLMALRLSMGLMPWFYPIEILNLSAQKLFGTPNTRFVGWAIHFVVGTGIWGLLFGWLVERLPGGTYTRRGILFGALAWFVVMITVFPAAGSGYFALGFGWGISVWTLIYHLIFGFSLGATYGWLRSL